MNLRLDDDGKSDLVGRPDGIGDRLHHLSARDLDAVAREKLFGLVFVDVHPTPITPTSSCTEAADFCNCARSSLVKLNLDDLLHTFRAKLHRDPDVEALDTVFTFQIGRTR